MGCDGHTPNVICPGPYQPNRRASWTTLPDTHERQRDEQLSRAPRFRTRFSATATTTWGGYDTQVGGNDHAFSSFWHQRAPAKFVSSLPQKIANGTFSDPQDSTVSRINWDRTFTSSLLNHMSMGYLNRNEGYGSINQEFVDDLPQIAGVAGYNAPPVIRFNDEFESGTETNRGSTSEHHHAADVHHQRRRDLDEERAYAQGWHGMAQDHGEHPPQQQQGRDVQLRPRGHRPHRRQQRKPGCQLPARCRQRRQSRIPRGRRRLSAANAWIFHAGDTWRVNDKLTLDYGLRWDYYSPSSEKNDVLSFFDPNGANPGAGGRPGRLAFAGDSYGAASYGARYPEEDWYGGFAPRLGGVYALNEKTVVRAGWGIFYTQAFYPGWNGGMSQDGFSNTPTFSASQGGISAGVLPR